MRLQMKRANRRGCSHRGLPSFRIHQPYPRLALGSGSVISKDLPGWTVSFPENRFAFAWNLALCLPGKKS